MCGVEVWRGGLGGAYRLPALSSAGASLFPPCFRSHTPLIEPDVADFPLPAVGEDSRNSHPFLSSLLAFAFTWSGKVVARKRASNDADVSTTSPIFPYGGFSPGWKVGFSGSAFPHVAQVKPAPGMPCASR